MKNKQEIKQQFEEILMKAEGILDFNHVRLQQGGIEIDLFVMSRLATPDLDNKLPSVRSVSAASAGSASFASFSELLDVEAYAEERRLNLSDETVSEQATKYRPMIQGAIQQIFWYRRFHKDDVMAVSPLHDLMVVQQACQTWRRERGIVPGALSKPDKATVLRKFLVCCLDKNLCPAPGTAPPENLASSELRNEWLEYLILRWQYVDGESREDVIRELSQNHCFITAGSTYTRRLQTARGRLAAIIYQKEMQALRKGGRQNQD